MGIFLLQRSYQLTTALSETPNTRPIVFMRSVGAVKPAETRRLGCGYRAQIVTEMESMRLAGWVLSLFVAVLTGKIT
jgi:hypothetical protein